MGMKTRKQWECATRRAKATRDWFPRLKIVMFGCDWWNPVAGSFQPVAKHNEHKTKAELIILGLEETDKTTLCNTTLTYNVVRGGQRNWNLESTLFNIVEFNLVFHNSERHASETSPTFLFTLENKRNVEWRWIESLRAIKLRPTPLNVSQDHSTSLTRVGQHV